MRREKSAKRRITKEKHYHAHRAKCDISTKKSKLRAKGVVEWPGIDLTPRPRGWPRVVPVQGPQWCSFLVPPLFNKFFYFYIVCKGYAIGMQGGGSLEHCETP